ncbi:bacillithiol system redox-active protein YtxJ [Bacillus suaedaesalsae]|uniref:Bacillithiol system redox-active protein YtxJ n=1 Tax=Bacillus suaedaesalsae TaxID=2810349 RepID=A0ABS2DD91_9BACI|nr:bacillithiol system redox-active protein YtxJ [Bacillus suaedaesalsae]MBM6616409.1 bacillithiol system redox-active protein YtxJ [Bacillus suaedaesalsae]
MKKRVSTIEQFEHVVKENKEFLLIKHSLTCPVSGAAFEEYEKFTEENKDVNTYYLYVQDDRPLSNYIAETCSIKHESPQVLLFKDGQVVWNASHWKITNKSLAENIKK